jgi:hypothetical protein
MTRAKSIGWIAGGAVLAVFALRATIFGQAVDSNKDTLDQLLVEVRGLRAAMEQMASAGPQVQLALGRLQLQEQRVNTMVRRADEARTNLANVQNEVAKFQESLRDRQQALERNTVPPEARNDIEAEIKAMKQQLSRLNVDAQRLQTEEAEATMQLTAEQARWVDINQRLEELERSLVRR